MRTPRRAVLTSTSPIKTKYGRKSQRYAVNAGEVRISWRDPSGKMRVGQARVLNISEHGIALELDGVETLPQEIRFQWAKYHIRGSGIVRYRCRVGRHVLVGLEFNDGLRHLAQEEAVETLATA